jgi:tRNA modification GTPase
MKQKKRLKRRKGLWRRQRKKIQKTDNKTEKMRKNLNTDTIVAISTPPGEGGISIVRLSGKKAISIVEKIFKSKARSFSKKNTEQSPKYKKLSQLSSHTIHYGYIKEKNRVLDEVLVSIMKAPLTYTREDIVEINCHGGIVPTSRILELILKKGVRLAEPGEFTKRAFINGRIDLVQAESVLDMIRAKTDLSLKAASQQLTGHLSGNLEKLNQLLKDIQILLEIQIDFSEEEIPLPDKKAISAKIKSSIKTIDYLLKSSEFGQILREGLRVSITGKPNVGKSSLLNLLLKKERAIVTHIPGTTRDTIEEEINIKGIPVRLIDTAGIRTPRSKIEKYGIERSQKSIKDTDLILVIFENHKKISPLDEKILKDTQNYSRIIVLNKIDLISKNDNISYIKKKYPKDKTVKLSALKGTGLKNLEKTILNFVYKGKISPKQNLIVTNIRHKKLMEKILSYLKNALKASKKKFPAEFIASDIKAASNCLGEIIGEITTEEILDSIFKDYCVGK